MAKRLFLPLFLFFVLSNHVFGIDAWIRINQLGYLPNGQKKAVFISESVHKITQFSIHDALTNEKLLELTTVKPFGEFQLFKSTYILDFSEFKNQGAFYIKAGLVYSPNIYINKNAYLGTADFLLNYLRGSRCGTEFTAEDNCLQLLSIEAQEKEEIKEEDVKSKNTKSAVKKNTKTSTVKMLEKQLPKMVDVTGGWHNSSDFTQYGGISANTVFQLLFAYQIFPAAFSDTHDATGKLKSNGLPDILDEAKWGLDWLLKMYPDKEKLYHQIVTKYGEASIMESSEDRADFGEKGLERWVYLANGKPQELAAKKNHTNEIASIAGKYASAFALGANIFSKYSATYADSLYNKALGAYQLGKNNPGTCQTLIGNAPYNYEETNWTDDMELAATQLYRLNYENSFMKDAASYGRMEPVTPWMLSDTARHYQWYPFVNIGHYMLANVENPRYQKEFLLNMQNGIERVKLNATENPFNIGVPMILSSNNFVTAMATQCLLYRTLSKDTTYLEMENSLMDWLLGCNPWGTSMVVGLPRMGISPSNTPGHLSQNNKVQNTGGLVSGPVGGKVYNQITDINTTIKDNFDRFQTPFALYHDSKEDMVTNEPILDGTASLAYLMAHKQLEGVPNKTIDKNEYTKGSVTRTDDSKKQISLVFSGHQYADGYKIISKTLKKMNIKASFFFTGDYYRNRKFKKTIKGLQADKHYLGANSDKYMLYCSFQNPDSLLVNKTTFLSDVKANYVAMDKFGIKKSQAPFFLPAYEFNNDSIAQWSKEMGLYVINSTAGTLSNTDASTPEMREKYFSTVEIFNRIVQVEKNQGMNGYILHFHIGTDKRRQDKFYNRLQSLLIELKRLGYEFVDLYKATDLIDKEEEVLNNNNKKRKH